MTGPAFWLLLGMAAPANPPLPSLPVPLMPGDNGPCSTANVIDLPRGETLAVRSGPSPRARVLARLRDGQPVYACVRQGDWFGIVWERGARRTGCNVIEHPRRMRYSVYIGPCPSGWVHQRYLGGYADWISP